MRKLLSAALAVAAWGLVGGPVGSSPAAAETIKIAHSTWVGYGPLYIARDRGFFKNHGVEVELTVMEDPKLRFTALRAGQINVIASTVDTALLYLKKPDDFKYVAAIDDSNGGDGIVATRDIQSIKDLKGKKVAVNEGSVSQFYLNVLLAKAGLKESDLQTVNMTAADAGSAFVAKKVDAAVTWEPWLSRGKASEHGHLLTDSSKTPGLITDVFIVPKQFVATHKKELKGIVAAWNEAVAYQRAHPDEANQIMAKGVGGWLKDPKVFAETLTGIKFYGAEDNKNFFGTKANPGPLSRTVQAGIDMARDGSLFVNTAASVTEIMAGFIVASLISVPLGILMGSFKIVEAAVEPVTNFVRYLPVSALIPLLILWVGIGIEEKITVIFIGTFFQQLILIADVSRGVSQDLLDVSYTLGADRRTVVTRVLIPATMPGVMDTLRVTLGWAWTYLVVAELVAGNKGLGYLILNASRGLFTDQIFLGIMVIGLLGLISDQLFKFIRDWLLPWASNP